MEAEELRIGNFVWVDGKITTVDSIDGSGINIEACGGYYIGDASMDHQACFEQWASNTSVVYPILLTEEWHHKFEGEEINPYRFKYPVGISDLIVNYDKIQQNWWFEYEISGKVTPLPPTIKGVHEFQNFYKEFTGEELTIKP